MNRLNYFLIHSESRWIVLLLTIAIFFLILFYFDYTAEADIGNRKIIGTIVYKNNQVQRKFSNEVVWSNLRSNSPLTNMDLIRSQNLSDAIIYLDEGTKIKIDENTMFFLDFSSGSLKLEFSGGSIQIEQGTKGVSGMTVKSGETLIEVGNADLKIVDSDDTKNGDINLFVSKGEASIQSGGKNNSIKANQKANIGSKGIAIKNVEVQLLKPGGQELISSGNSALEFDFKTQKGYQSTGLDIAKDKQFKNIVKRATPAQAKKGVNLGSGSYYWRVTAKNKATGKKVNSEVRRFRMVENNPVKTFIPESNTKIHYVEEKPSVTFTWESSNLAAEYILEIAKDKKFQKQKKEYKTRVNRINVNDLDNGDYYWRIKSVSNIVGMKNQTSKISNLQIKKTNKYLAPLPGRPVDGAEVSSQEFKSGVLFVWQAMPELKSYRFELSPKRSFKPVAFSKNTTDNFIKLKKSPGLNIYYWRVQGTSAAGKSSEFSKPAVFEVVDQKTLIVQDDNNKGQLEIIGPRGVVDMSKKNALTFKWKKQASVKDYLFTLYHFKGNRPILKIKKRIIGNFWILQDLSKLDTGKFRWRIEASPTGSKKIVKTMDFKIILSAQPGHIKSEDVEFISPEVMYK